MTGPATQTRRWRRYVYAAFSTIPDGKGGEVKDENGKPKLSAVVGSVFSVHAPQFSHEHPKSPKPSGKEPALPTGCQITEGDTLITITRAKDNDVEPNEIAAARDWLSWRWIPGYRLKVEEL